VELLGLIIALGISLWLFLLAIFPLFLVIEGTKTLIVKSTKIPKIGHCIERLIPKKVVLTFDVNSLTEEDKEIFKRDRTLSLISTIDRQMFHLRYGEEGTIDVASWSEGMAHGMSLKRMEQYFGIKSIYHKTMWTAHLEYDLGD
jgi:hypothetical protein